VCDTHTHVKKKKPLLLCVTRMSDSSSIQIKTSFVITEHVPFYTRYNNIKSHTVSDYDAVVWYYKFLHHLRTSVLFVNTDTNLFNGADHAFIRIAQETLHYTLHHTLRMNPQSVKSSTIIRYLEHVVMAVNVKASKHTGCEECNTPETKVHCFVDLFRACDREIAEVYTKEQQFVGATVASHVMPLIRMLIPVREVANIVLHLIETAYFEQDSQRTFGSIN